MLELWEKEQCLGIDRLGIANASQLLEHDKILPSAERACDLSKHW